MKAGWEVKRLGEVCENISTGPFGSLLGKKDYQDEGIPLVNPIDIVEGEIQSRSTKKVGPQTAERLHSYRMSVGDIVIARRGELGRCAQIRDEHKDFLCGTGSFYLRPNRSVLVDYLEQYLRSSVAVEFFEKASTGATMPNISNKTLTSLPIPIPPLEEQKQIVAVLDAAFEGLTRATEHAKANLQNARELFESYISERLNKMDSEEITLLEMMERGWIASHLDGNHGSNYPKKGEFIDEGVPYISANCIVDGEIDISLAKYLSANRADTLVKGTAYDQDVIFAHNATVGPVAVLETEEDRVLLGTSVTHYRCNPEFLDPYFLCYEMRGAEFVRQYESVMGQATRNQVPITIQRTFRHRIPNLESQRELTRTARTAEKSARNMVTGFQFKLTDIADLRQSLLQKAFAGELT